MSDASENRMEETQPWGSTFYTAVPESHTSFQTDRAKVDLITNPHFGRMLFIDGELQSCTSDEHIYHTELISAAMSKRQEQKRVLIAGGAEGATIRQVQDWEATFGLGVEEILMVDWDEHLVRHMENEEPWSRGAFDDPRLRLEFEDISVWIDNYKKNNGNSFDTIVLDLLDPTDESEFHWLESVIRKSLEFLVPGGCLTVNVGGRYDLIHKYFGSLMKERHGYVKEIFVPSFQEPWHLLTLS